MTIEGSECFPPRPSRAEVEGSGTAVMLAWSSICHISISKESSTAKIVGASLKFRGAIAPSSSVDVRNAYAVLFVSLKSDSCIKRESHPVAYSNVDVAGVAPSAYGLVAHLQSWRLIKIYFIHLNRVIRLSHRCQSGTDQPNP